MTDQAPNYKKKRFVSVYQLEMKVGSRWIPFYIGCTEDPRRRESEHRTRPHNPKSPDYYNYKYCWIRELDKSKIEWRMTVLSDMVEDDQDSEYEWILRVARNNQYDGFKFYDDLPLTNMKAGSLLADMLADKTINTVAQIREFRQKRAEPVIQFDDGRSTASSVFSKLGGTSVMTKTGRVWAMPKPQKRKNSKNK